MPPLFVKEVSGRGEPNPKPLHTGGIEHHTNELQERGGFRGRVIQSEHRQEGQNATTKPFSSHAERLANQEKAILPTYLDQASRYFAAEWIAPKKEVLHGWDNFTELAFDMANLLSKPDDPSIPKYDIDEQDHQDLIGKHLPADQWEKSVVGLLERRGFARKIPQFKEDMEEYRNTVKAIVQEWRESGLL